MKMQKPEKRSLDSYIATSKSDIYVYGIIFIVLFFILLYIGYRIHWYYIILFGFLMFFRTLEKVETYDNLKKIKKYLIEQAIIEKMGNIYFWNEKYCLLTDYYMIVVKHKIVYAFRYSEIDRIYKEWDLKLGKNSSTHEYLHVVVDNQDFKILIWTNFLVGENFWNMSTYLLEKNPHIQFDKTIIHKKYKPHI